MPSELEEGAELLAKIENENAGIQTTPRWPVRLGKHSMAVKVEVQSPEEAKRLLRQKEIQLGGKGRVVEEWGA